MSHNYTYLEKDVKYNYNNNICDFIKNYILTDGCTQKGGNYYEKYMRTKSLYFSIKSQIYK
jgi:hypothetical protein